MAAPSNAAVDAIMHRVIETGFLDGLVKRCMAWVTHPCLWAGSQQRRRDVLSLAPAHPAARQRLCKVLLLVSVLLRYNPSIIRVGTSTSPLIVGNALSLDSRVEELLALRMEQVKAEVHRLERDRLSFHAEVWSGVQHCVLCVC